jgi:UDP-2,3-diacylglucosamine pyrophosphatase LpxH
MRVGRWLKRNSKTFIRNAQIVRNRAISYAQHKKADIIICGHTHHPEDIKVDNIRYLNSGSWTDSPAHFIGFSGERLEVVPFY